MKPCNRSKIIVFIFVVSVISVYFNTIYKLNNKVDTNTRKNSQKADYNSQSKLSNNNYSTLEEVAKMVGVDRVHEEGVTGKGVTVAVVDSGVYIHDDLIKPNNRIIAFKDFVNNLTDPYDDSGHGTSIAGIIAGNGYSNKECIGMAPDANLVIVKALNRDNSARISTLINGLNWVIDNKDKYNIKILNLSLGVAIRNEDENQKLINVVEKAYDSGILVITSVGNLYNNESIVYSPAISNKVLAVGSISDTILNSRFEYSIADFSDHWINEDGTIKPDLIAPGNRILSLESDIYYKPSSGEKLNKKNTYSISSGTSESSAVLTGIAALIMQQHSEKLPAEIIEVLEKQCVKLSSSDKEQGHGFIYVRPANNSQVNF
ncbi:S8 family serine peptidase [Clostridium sp. C8-1-8]|uniref:S8 family serine peptidase n=1 Tax=Clostridium sp. C8-1-8 TaxID=2698831 RepID=UPI00136FDDF0|nr:S8 family serine peptidase [Clostridium sp. C8-1-8]